MSADVAVRPALKESVHWQGRCPGESILIYITVDGAVTPMRVSESDSIASVKMRIQTCKGIPGNRQKLVYGGRELARKDALIKDYGVTASNVLHLVLRLSDMIFIVVRTTGGKEFEFQIDRHRNVEYLKQRIKKKGKDFIDLDGCQDLFCEGEELQDQSLFRDFCNADNGVIHLVAQKSAKVDAKPVHKDLELSVVADDSEEGGNQVTTTKTRPSGDFLLEPVFVNPNVNLFPFLWDMIGSTLDGLKQGNHPMRSSEGTGGTYFMQDSTGMEYVSVFKPIDEEPNAVNNPQGLPVSSNGEGLKRGTRVGEGAVREVAAYILDHPRAGPRLVSGEAVGFSGVPPTVMVQCLNQHFNHPNGFDFSPEHSKVGSLQAFMKNDGNCEDLGPGSFSVEEVHKITVLDLRMANADRHAGNILYRKDADGRTLLIPIDHGYCLPEKFEDCTFDWLYWPQARKPYSPDTVDYIKSLNAEKDIELLKYYGWDVPVECARTLRISTMLLKKGVERGLSPYDIGSIMCRENLNKKSVIEEIICEAQESMLPGMGESVFLESVSQIMDSRLDKLSK
ncbi:phosphatidylinositol 4-kinase gamma 2-like [Vigna umbellata]|uniref:phosphatidylinositol 4-kinase gamma 2-like n=1 Tax=Vigna umbellata TaxID=87088 RepID=UPI001F5EE5DF|nr:phosphatidylinositol 4-kinase gamma 2-like [Vigna umbellata]